jgi:predicted nucleic acid-binding protein
MGAELAVSDVILYESQKAIAFDPKKSGEVSDFISQYLTRYLVDDNVLIQAARVHEIYGSHETTKNYRSGFSTEDIIIGTTAMLLGAYVLTTDCNDFPAPFFKEVSRNVIYYEVKNRRRYKVIYVLEPDQQVIGEAVDNLTGTNKVVETPKKTQKKMAKKK